MHSLFGIEKMNIDPFPLSVIEQQEMSLGLMVQPWSWKWDSTAGRLQRRVSRRAQPWAGAPTALAGGQGRATGVHLPSAPFAGGLGGFSPVHGVPLAHRGFLLCLG